MTPRRIAPYALAVSLLVACGTGAESDTSLTRITTATTVDSATTAAVGTATPPDSTMPATTVTTTPTTATTPTTPTEEEAAEDAAEDDVDRIGIEIPQGSFEVGPGDVFAVDVAGDLLLLPGLLGPRPGVPTLVAEYPDPRASVGDGPGPNVIDDVAGVIGGSVVFSDCCEPISGNILAATGTTVGPVVGGASPELSPAGDRIVVANSLSLFLLDAATGVGISRLLNDPIGPDGFISVQDASWSIDASPSTADDHPVVLASDQTGHWLFDVDDETLELAKVTELGVPPVRDGSDEVVRFAGHGPDDEVAVAVSSAAGTRIRYFTPSTLTEVPDLERSLPPSVSSVRLADDGVGLLWVDDDRLFFLPAGEFEAHDVGTGYTAAWFARSALSGP